MTRATKGSPLRGRYLVRNRPWNAALRIGDALLATIARQHLTHGSPSPRRILIAVGGHLGDAVIATSVLPVIARAFPHATLGMLLPSWSRQVVERHPLVRWIHQADHWKMNRGTTSAAARWRRHRTTTEHVVREMRAVKYDVAIDLYAYYPNSARLLWRAGIPTRIGYTSGGCGPLYTTAIGWKPVGHTAAQHERLLGELSIPATDEHRYDLPPLSRDAVERAHELIRGDYVVLHPGTGDEKKAWPADRWHQLVDRLSRNGDRIAITGRGVTEQRVGAELTERRANVVNLVDRLDWETFRAVVAGASLLIGPDSVAAHVAAAADVPTIAIMAAMSDPEFWRPLGRQVVTLTRTLACAPCFQKRGCAAMSCVRDVAVDDVVGAINTLRDLASTTSTL